jgi:hypothetical protein
MDAHMVACPSNLISRVTPINPIHPRLHLRRGRVTVRNEMERPYTRRVAEDRGYCVGRGRGSSDCPHRVGSTEMIVSLRRAR